MSKTVHKMSEALLF